MKKSAQSIKKSKDTELQKRAENNITIVSCSIIIYALVLVLVNSMFSSEATMAGARTVRLIMIYLGLGAGMVIASYSAYKSNKSLIKYALMCFFVSISTLGILYGNPWGTSATVIALVAAFLFVCVYAILTDKRIYYSSKKARTIFKSVIAVVYGVLLVVVVAAIVKNAIDINKALNKTYGNADSGADYIEAIVDEPTTVLASE
ncbi:MAG: hypothetical protein IJ316_05395 [Clostridia bacterium]|nr:hypothetical protein [Clostridia bacterium]